MWPLDVIKRINDQAVRAFRRKAKSPPPSPRNKPCYFCPSKTSDYLVHGRKPICRECYPAYIKAYGPVRNRR